MATSPVVPREKLSAYQRWEIGSFDQPPPGMAPSRASAAERVKPIDENAKAEGFRAGHAAGMEAGRREALADGATRVARLDALLAGLETDLQRVDRELALEVVQLGLAVARKLVGAALQVRPEIVQASVEEALRQVAQVHAAVQIVVHPEDAAAVRAHFELAPRVGAWSIREDAGIARGGCRIESATGEVDATLAQRWERVTAALGEPLGWVA
jgi:flagellar assembly protein FliH